MTLEAPQDDGFPTPKLSSTADPQPRSLKLVCPLIPTGQCNYDKPFTTPSNLKRHIKTAHQEESVKCPVAKCGRILAVSQVHTHVAVHHRYSFRDKEDKENYVAVGSLDPLPSVDDFWRRSGKQTPALPTRVTRVRDQEVVYAQDNTAVPHTTPTPARESMVVYNLPSVAPTELEYDLARAAHLPAQGIFTGNVGDVLTEEESDALHELLVIPQASTRDQIYVPEEFRQPGKVDEPTPKKRRVASKDELMCEYKEVEAHLQKYTKRKAEIKRLLKEIEEEEKRSDKEQIKKLRQQNALLEERLLAARELRKQEEQARRQGSLGPCVGERILGF